MPPFDNRSLFSDHYLAERLGAHPAWAEDASAAWDATRALYQQRRAHLARMNEAQTEEEWVKPLLTGVLGWAYSVQTDATLFGRRNRPDYALFLSEQDRLAAQSAPDGRLDYARAAAVGDAKFWGRPLDREVRDRRDPLSNANPSFQIVNYLVATGVEWGILTNGQEWRLYSTRARSRVDTYYAVDLLRLLEADDAEGFRYFYHFFRAAAFRRDPASGRSFLEAVHAQSVTYGAELEAKLKRLIFDELFEGLAAGFVAERRERGVQETEATLAEVYGGTLRLLYRLLFLLHAEARELLPVRDAGGYYRHSLTRLKQEVKEMLERGDRLSRRSYRLWGELADLFGIIDRGDPELGVPRYNGGLFRADHPRNGFLAGNRVADHWLAPALDRLARAGEPHFIDYKSLSVEQLGSIYEGLLEFRLRLAPEALAVVRARGGDVYHPAAEVAEPARVIAAGEPYLENDRGERKQSGSYYTPQYIVEHIVRQTLGPVLAEREAAFRALMERAAPGRERLAEVERHLAAEPARADATATRWAHEAAALRAELRALDAEAVEALLGLRVCDPAMGSGHFLVRAADWLTERLIVLLNQYPGNPVLARIEAIRAEIVQTLAEQGIQLDAAALKDTHLLKRMVMKRCIYGVDLNPMATELAKLSLWLDSFTIGAPLSFLDHHLKTGNSLVGTRVEQVQREYEADRAGQLHLQGGPFAGLMAAAVLMRDVGSRTDATFSEVAQSAALYADYQAAVAPYARVLDLWVSQHFGNQKAAEYIFFYGDDAIRAAATEPRQQKHGFGETVATARRLSAEQRFFHWDLEFPEVFVDLERGEWKDDPGFDAVLGNPPYVRQELLAPLKPFLKKEFAAFHAAADLYLYFYEQGLRILRQRGRLAYISSGTFARAAFATPLRQWLPTVAQVESVIDFGENQPFEGAEMVRPSILVLRKGEGGQGFRSLFLAGGVPPSLSEALEHEGSDCAAEALALPEWTFQPAATTRLFQKLQQRGTTLGELVGGRLYRGILTGLNDAFVIDTATRDRLVAEDERSREVIRPVLRGEDLRPWYQEDEGRWLIVLPAGWTKARARRSLGEEAAWRVLEREQPAVAAQLRPYVDAARARGDKGDYWWELRSCDYYDAFEGTKILWPDISKLPRFSWGEAGLYATNTCYVTPTDDPSLLGILQSRVSWFGISQLCQPLRLRAGLWQYRLFPQFLSRLPVPELAGAAKRRVGQLALELSALARERYALHQRARHRLATDLGGGGPLNRRLTEWWALDFAALRAEVKRQLRADIPVRERDEWEAWLAQGRAEHQRLTAEIVVREEELNRRVYDAFELSAEEVRRVEESTQYRYGEV